MATNDLLQRSSIRTMKKDIASLREADSLQEKQKISNIKIDNKSGTDSIEIEKQRAFLLRSQKTNLEKQLQGINFKENISLREEKNKVFLEKENLQKKVNAMSKAEEMGIELDENAEKKQWVAEGNMVTLENKLKGLEEKNQLSQSVQNNIEKEIGGIDNSLKNIDSVILERKKVEEQPRSKVEPSLPKTPSVEQSSLQDKAFLKEVPLPAKEKLAETTRVEEKQRAKFMEDVERWAASSDTNQENN